MLNGISTLTEIISHRYDSVKLPQHYVNIPLFLNKECSLFVQEKRDLPAGRQVELQIVSGHCGQSSGGHATNGSMACVNQVDERDRGGSKCLMVSVKVL